MSIQKSQSTVQSAVGRATALGVFDGIHIGHAALMRDLLDVSKKSNLAPTVITFDTLPQNFLSGKSVPLINSPEDRVGLIQRLFGITNVIFLHFDKTLAAMPWSEFVDYLADVYDVKCIIAGSNFRFGAGALGNSDLLMERCNEQGIECHIISDIIHDGIVCNSTYIRELLRNGDIERANEFLGHPHILTDVVRSGQRIGRRLDAPTINMQFAPNVLIPAFGVYATKMYIDGEARTGNNLDIIDTERLPAITNIGVRPTVDCSGRVTVETHIPGYKNDLYGQRVRIEFHKYIRPEMKFDDIGALKGQIKKDCERAMEYFC